MSTLLRSIEKWIHGLTIRTKVILFSMSMVMVSAACIISILYLNISGIYRRQMQYSQNQSFMQAQEFILYKVRSMIYASAVINYNNDIQTALSNSLNNTDASSFQEQYTDMLTMEHVLSTVGLQEYVFNASIYVPSTLFYADTNMYFNNLDDIQDTYFYRALANERVPLIWLPPQDIPTPAYNVPSMRMISMMRAIRSSTNSSILLGIQRVSILADDLDSILRKSDISQQGVVFLRNSHGELISCSNAAAYTKLAVYENAISDSPADATGWHDVRVHNQRLLMKSKNIPNTDWALTAMIPYKEITRQSTQVGLIMLVLMCMIGAIACLCSYLFAESIAQRLRMLTGKMELVQNGDLTVSIETNYEDEIGYLFCSFNYMTQRLANLAEEQYNSGKAIKSAELRALQAQINPHFLYNTLDLINWEALDNHSEKISKLTQALAKYYKLSLSKGQDFVSLSDEIEHVKTYIQIQNYRFDNRIHLTVQIPDELMSYPIIKLVLQPLAENAILHGQVGSNFIKYGCINITGELYNNVIMLQITDNGIGADETAMKNLLNHEIPRSSYGLYNIDQRFKLYYGEEYGLSFQSTLNAGTAVSVRFPAK